MNPQHSSYNILISNDDGIHATGMATLIEILKPLGHITVVAPDGPRSGASSSITSAIPLVATKMKDEPGLTYYRMTATPADCIKYALNLIFVEDKPDLVVTGINHGRNDAICVFYSGTIGAALEACIAGIPALAISLNDHDADADMSYAADFAYPIAKHLLQYKLPKHTMLSLNLPTHKPKGLKVCPQGITHFVDEYTPSDNGRGKTVYWMTGYQQKSNHEEHTDFDNLNEGYATLTPLKLDLTNRELLKEIQTEFSPLFTRYGEENKQ